MKDTRYESQHVPSDLLLDTIVSAVKKSKIKNWEWILVSFIASETFKVRSLPYT